MRRSYGCLYAGAALVAVTNDILRRITFTTEGKEVGVLAELEM